MACSRDIHQLSSANYVPACASMFALFFKHLFVKNYARFQRVQPPLNLNGHAFLLNAVHELVVENAIGNPKSQGALAGDLLNAIVVKYPITTDMASSAAMLFTVPATVGVAAQGSKFAANGLKNQISTV